MMDLFLRFGKRSGHPQTFVPVKPRNPNEVSPSDFLPFPIDLSSSSGLGRLQNARHVDILETTVSRGTDITFENRIVDEHGVLLFAVKDESQVSGFCGTGYRDFYVSFFDESSNMSPVVTLRRPSSRNDLVVSVCNKEKQRRLGYIRKGRTLFNSHFEVMSMSSFTPEFHIIGPFWTSNCCQDVNFKVQLYASGIPPILFSLETEVLGRFTRRQAGCCPHPSGALIRYSVDFPRYFDIEEKLLILAAMFQVDLSVYKRRLTCAYHLSN